MPKNMALIWNKNEEGEDSQRAYIGKNVVAHVYYYPKNDEWIIAGPCVRSDETFSDWREARMAAEQCVKEWFDRLF